MSFGTILYTWLCGNFVGKDEYGNKYYCNSKNFESHLAKRWVLYYKEVEASKIKTKAVRMDRLLKLRELLSSYESTKSSLKRLFKRDKLYKEELLPQISEQPEATLTAYTNDDGSFADVSRARIAQLNAKIIALNISVEIKKSIVKLNYLFAKNNKNILNIQGDNK